MSYSRLYISHQMTQGPREHKNREKQFGAFRNRHKMRKMCFRDVNEAQRSFKAHTHTIQSQEHSKKLNEKLPFHSFIAHISLALKSLVTLLN